MQKLGLNAPNFNQLSNMFIVIDAMDECFTEDVRHRLLSILRSWNSAKILITSRPIPTIQNALLGATILIIIPNAVDIGTHIRARTLHNPNLTKLVPRVSSADLETKVVEQADGMFLLAELHIKHLSEQTNVKAFLSALKALPNDASATYARALERINQQSSKVKQLALYALSWIYRARRPLRMIELQYGIAGTRSGCAADESELDDEELVISACAGLLVVNQDTKTVNFIHYTVQEYIERAQGDFLSEVEIAKCCMNIISLPGVQFNPPSNPLIEYAASCWGYLVQNAKDDDSIIHAALSNLETPAQFAAIWAAASTLEEFQMPTDTSASDTQDPHPLHIAAAFGLDRIAQILLEGYPNAAGQTDAYGRTPLHFAARRGYAEVVKTLLDAHVDVDPIDSLHRTPLLLAAEFRHSHVVAILLGTENVNVNATHLQHGFTPLLWAAWNGDLELVQLLIQVPKIAMDVKGKYGVPPLSLAVTSGNVEVVKVLLSLSPVEVDAKDNHGRTPLHWAAKRRQSEVVQLLLDNPKVDADAEDTSGQSPLSYASADGHLPVVKLLLDTGKVQVDRKDREGQTPLSRAVEQGHLDVVRFLLDTNRVDVDVLDSTYQSTPLLRAALNGHLQVVMLLCDNPNVSLHAKNKFGESALLLAAKQGRTEVVKFLLTLPNVDVSAVDGDGRTPLWAAAEKGHVELVKLLAEKAEHDIDRRDNFGRTPFSIAAHKGHYAVARFLLDTQRVNANAVDGNGRTPLSEAAAEGHLELVKLLAEKAEHDIDRPDNFGNTPLGIAASKGHHAVVQFLLESRKVTVTAELRAKELVLAAYNSDLGMVKLLLEHPGYSIELPDNDGKVPFSAAVFSGNLALVKFLFNMGQVDINATDANHESVFSYATSGGNADVVNFLLQTGKVIDINAKDAFGQTAFVWAAWWSRLEVVKLLLNLPTIDVHAQDRKGLTAVFYAAEGRLGRTENPIAVLDLLLNDPRIAENLSPHHLRPIKRTKPQLDVSNQRDPSPVNTQNNDSNPICLPKPEEPAPSLMSSIVPCDDTSSQRSPSPIETTERRIVSLSRNSQRLTVFMLGSIIALVLGLRLARRVVQSQ